MREKSTSTPLTLTTLPDANATGAGVSSNTIALQLDMPDQLGLHLPFIGVVRLPTPQQLAYYCAVTALVALDRIEWPVALLITAGHALTQQQHNKSLEDIGEVLEHLV